MPQFNNSIPASASDYLAPLFPGVWAGRFGVGHRASGLGLIWDWGLTAWACQPPGDWQVRLYLLVYLVSGINALIAIVASARRFQVLRFAFAIIR